MHVLDPGGFMPHRLIRPRNHHELVFNGVTAVAGFVFLLAGGPRSLDRIPWWLVDVWSTTLALFGTVVVVGIVAVRDRHTAAVVERVGLIAVTPAAAAYGIAVLSLSGAGGTLAGVWGLGLAYANGVEIRRITRWRRAVIAAGQQSEQDNGGPA